MKIAAFQGIQSVVLPEHKDLRFQEPTFSVHLFNQQEVSFASYESYSFERNCSDFISIQFFKLSIFQVDPRDRSPQMGKLFILRIITRTIFICRWFSLQNLVLPEWALSGEYPYLACPCISFSKHTHLFRSLGCRQALILGLLSLTLCLSLGNIIYFHSFNYRPNTDASQIHLSSSLLSPKFSSEISGLSQRVWD